jgi:hypothetical protein
VNKQECYDLLEQMIKLAKNPGLNPRSHPPGVETPEEKKERILQKRRKGEIKSHRSHGLESKHFTEVKGLNSL